MTDEIQSQLRHFFPHQKFSIPKIEKGLEKGEILVDPQKILPYLQTALMDEKVLEVELNGVPRVYFSRIKDDEPEPLGEKQEHEDEKEPKEPEYTQGEYLNDLTYIVTLPLEPGLGNLHLRNSRSIILRMFTNSFAVEMAATFEELAEVQGIPVLKLSFPPLARIAHNVRAFRAKVPDSLNFVVSSEFDESLPPLECPAIDISLKGMAFAIKKNEQKFFKLGTAGSFKLYLEDELLARLDGTVRNLARVRKRIGIEYICGIEFDLPSKLVMSVVESIVASVQRAHLRELAEKSETMGIDLIA